MVLSDLSLSVEHRERLTEALGAIQDLGQTLGKFGQMRKFRIHTPGGADHPVIDLDASSIDSDNPRLG